MDVKNFAVVIVKLDEGKVILMTDKDGVVTAFEGEHKGVEYFEAGYRKAHRRSYEGSMSACINYMFFKPSVVVFASTEELQKALDIKIPFQIVTASNVSGYMHGILLDPKKAEKIWNKGVKPKLID